MIYQPQEVEEVKVVKTEKKRGKDYKMKEHHAAAKRLDNAKLVLRRFTKVDNELRSPVTKEELVAEVSRQLFVQVEPENLHLSAHLSSVGEFEVPLRLPKSLPLPEGKVQWSLVKVRRPYRSSFFSLSCKLNHRPIKKLEWSIAEILIVSWVSSYGSGSLE